MNSLINVSIYSIVAVYAIAFLIDFAQMVKACWNASEQPTPTTTVSETIQTIEDTIETTQTATDAPQTELACILASEFACIIDLQPTKAKRTRKTTATTPKTPKEPKATKSTKTTKTATEKQPKATKPKTTRKTSVKVPPTTAEN